jgi:hypothetical protein
VGRRRGGRLRGLARPDLPVNPADERRGRRLLGACGGPLRGQGPAQTVLGRRRRGLRRYRGPRAADECSARSPLVFALPPSSKAISLFIGGGIPFAAALAAYNVRCYGGVLQSGYQKTGILEALALRNFPPRLRHYGGWISRTLTPLVPLAWLGLLVDRKPAWRDRALLLSWFGSFLVLYCLYEPYDSFLFVRFLLPAAPGLILGAVLLLHDVARRFARPRVRVSVSVAVLVLVLFAEGHVAQRLGVLGTAEGESIYPRACDWAARSLPADALVLSMTMTGVLEHYTSLAYARYDWIEPAELLRLRERIAQRGGRVYALLFPFEVEDLAMRLPSRWKKLGVLRDVTLWELED